MGTNLRSIAATIAGLLLLLVAAGCGGDSGDGAGSGGSGGRAATATTSPGAAASTPGSRVPVEGFGEIAYRVQTLPNVERCALLAQTSAQHAQGLMFRRDLSGYDGMLFVFEEETTTSFYMKDTPLPLSIAWFDGNGLFVSATDMEPCLDKPECPTYGAARAYRYALEVPQGGLRALGIGPGSVISVGGACT